MATIFDRRLFFEKIKTFSKLKKNTFLPVFLNISCNREKRFLSYPGQGTSPNAMTWMTL